MQAKAATRRASVFLAINEGSAHLPINLGGHISCPVGSQCPHDTNGEEGKGEELRRSHDHLPFRFSLLPEQWNNNYLQAKAWQHALC